MNACYKCLTIDHDACMLGEKCNHFNADNLKTEIERRRKERKEKVYLEYQSDRYTKAVRRRGR